MTRDRTSKGAEGFPLEPSRQARFHSRPNFPSSARGAVSRLPPESPRARSRAAPPAFPQKNPISPASGGTRPQTSLKNPISRLTDQKLSAFFPYLLTVVVAQLVRASDCDSEGRGFKSPLSPHFSLASELRMAGYLQTPQDAE